MTASSSREWIQCSLSFTFLSCTTAITYGFVCAILLTLTVVPASDLDSILKSRDITLPTKVCLVKAMVFAVVMYGCESWIVKKAQHQKIDGFELWCWRRLLKVLDCKEIQPVPPKRDQSWVFIGRTDVEAETPILWPPVEKS